MEFADVVPVPTATQRDPFHAPELAPDVNPPEVTDEDQFDPSVLFTILFPELLNPKASQDDPHATPFTERLNPPIAGSHSRASVLYNKEVTPSVTVATHVEPLYATPVG